MDYPITAIRPIDKVLALYQYGDLESNAGAPSNCLDFKQGDIIYVLNKNRTGWWDGIKINSNKSVQRGWFPQNYTKPLMDKKLPITSSSSSSSSSISTTTAGNSRNSSVSVTVPMSPTHSLSQLNSTAPPENNTSAINVLSLQELEVLFDSSLAHEFGEIPLWHSVIIDNDEGAPPRVLYFNEKLNVYCDQLPLLSRRSQTRNNKKSASSSISESVCASATKYNKHKPHSHRNHHQKLKNINDLFYNHTTDIKDWAELRDLNLQYLNLTHESFITHDKETFSKYLSLTTTYTTYTNLACHLSNYMGNMNFDNSFIRKTIKKLLKKIISLLSMLSINSTVYFRELNAYPTSNPHINQSPNVYRNDSTSTTDTIINNMNDLSKASFSKNNYHKNSIQFSNSDSKSLFEVIDIELIRFKRKVSTLYEIIIQTNIDHNYNNQLLPQLSPRFIKGSFNGGSWRNPFYNPISNYSFDEALHRSSLPPCSLKSHTILNSELNPSVDSYYINFIVSSRSRYLSSNTICNAASTTNTTNFINNNNTASSSNYSSKKQRKAKYSSKSDANYPLNNETLQTLKDHSTELSKRYIDSEAEEFEILKLPSTKKRNIELTSKTYQEVNSSLRILEIMENIDLSIFINLKKLVKNPTSELNDIETEEFLKHILSSVLSVLTEFFDIKQLLHDVFIRLILVTQQLSIDSDPYVFSAMRSDHEIGYLEPSKSKFVIKKQAKVSDFVAPSDVKEKRMQKLSQELLKSLINQDVEINGMDFFNTSTEFKETYTKYVEITSLCCEIVQQLIEERENLINYSARMMKNDLIVELLKNDIEFSTYDDNDKNYCDNYVLISDLLQKNNTDESDKEHYDDNDSINSRKSFNSEGEDEEDDDHLTSISSDENASKDSAPWYLRCDHEYSLLYDAKGRIRGGNKDSLIEHLTNHLSVDVHFTISFLLTFRSIFTTIEFIYALIYRYYLVPPEGLRYSEYNECISKKLQPIKFNVINILRTFFTDYWTKAYYEQGMDVVLHLASVAVSENIPGSNELIQAIKQNVISSSNDISNHFDMFVDKNISNVDTYITDTCGSTNNSVSKYHHTIVPQCIETTAIQSALFKPKKIKLFDIDPYIYATQLTILEQELFLKITVFDCLDRAWGSRYCNMGGSKNISNFISSANQLTNYVSHLIVSKPDAKKRARVIQYFITVAHHCRILNNFSSMTAIISAFYSSPIYRLKKTWPLISKESNEILRGLNELMDSTKNFVKYRQLVKSTNHVPCVPFFGVYLSDLTFTYGGNQDFIKGTTDIINFGKRLKIAEILQTVMEFKILHYRLKPIEDLQDFIESSLENVPHIEKQYELSLAIEARPHNTNGYSTAANFLNDKRFNDKTEFDIRSSKLLKFGRKKQASRLFR